MTDIPEHLLRRSKERREALGLGTGGEAPSASPAEPAAAPADEAAAEEPAAASAPAPVPAAAAAVPAEPEPEPVPPYVEAAVRRPKIPVWAVPVLAVLPLWALVYAGALTQPSAGADDPLAIGEEVYTTNCATCHGPSGGGGVGPQLSGGNVETTFPDPEQHAEFVRTGSEPFKGEVYGDPDRPNPRVAQGGMPGWEGQLSDEEIVAVVRYEREVLSNAEPWEGAGEGGAEGGPEGGDDGESTGGEGEGESDDTGEAGSEGGNVSGDQGEGSSTEGSGGGQDGGGATGDSGQEGANQGGSGG